MPVELLAIVAVVILLAGVLIPSAARLKTRSASIQCLNNHKQIINAWQMYAQANDGECANNFTIPYILASITSGAFDNWANNVMTWSAGTTTTDISVTNEAWVAKGILHPFTDGDIEIYRCPSDQYISPAQKQRGYTKRVRTVSMNTVVGRPERTPQNSERSWAFGSAYRQWLRVKNIPQPSQTWVTMDEHPDSINDGMMINDVTPSSWVDIPGSLHQGATPVSFADGHVETRKWRSRTSKLPVRFQYIQPPTFDAEGRKDYAWYIQNSGLVRY